MICCDELCISCDHLGNMPGKPFQSKLIPYRKEIAALRKTWPPTTYEKISKILRDRHGLEVSPNAIWSFVKVRALSPPKQVYTLPEIKEIEVPQSSHSKPENPITPQDPNIAAIKKRVHEKKEKEKEKLEKRSTENSEWNFDGPLTTR